MESSGLKVKQLSASRDKRCLFKNLSFELQPGALLLIEGPNGSGKSTLLRILAGLITPESGSIAWQGKPLNPDYFNHMHFLGHSNGLKLELTVSENLQLASSLALKTEPVSTVGLRELGMMSEVDTPINHLSAGQKRRAALARVFSIAKPLWLLDEPLTALDANTIASVLMLLKNHLRSGGIAVLSSHQSIILPGIVAQIVRLPLC